MNKTKKIAILLFALAAISVVLTYTTYAALSSNKTLDSAGNIKVSPNLGIYQDSACTVPVTDINWGSVTPGTSISQTMYVKNIGQGTSLALSLATSNWNPAAANGPISISWNLEGQRLYPGQSAAAVITTTVSPTIADISDFDVQITMTGAQ